MGDPRPNYRQQRLQTVGTRQNRTKFRQLLRYFFMTDKGKKLIAGLEAAKTDGVEESVKQLIQGASLSTILEDLTQGKPRLSYDELVNGVMLKLNALDLLDYLEEIEVDDNLDVLFIFINETADKDSVEQLVEQIKTFLPGTKLAASPDDLRGAPGEITVDPQNIRFWVVVACEKVIPDVKVPQAPTRLAEPVGVTEPEANVPAKKPAPVEVEMLGNIVVK